MFLRNEFEHSKNHCSNTVIFVKAESPLQRQDRLGEKTHTTTALPKQTSTRKNGSLEAEESHRSALISATHGAQVCCSGNVTTVVDDGNLKVGLSEISEVIPHYIQNTKVEGLKAIFSPRAIELLSQDFEHSEALTKGKAPTE
ncbi:hypothetical protein HAX54_001011 [Datura stramonium]|uniref:Uncharacterized protein n=1 Tax=Datura stramonium TaxID=4076 RepID=A0ABS8T381_DATST|nr:hypothetical protein [Datura stramonium]